MGTDLSDLSLETSLMNRLDRMGATSRSYPEPWFDIVSTYTPTNIQDAFRWGELFFTAVPEVGRICKDEASYPITHIIYRAQSEAVKKEYEFLFDRTMKIRSAMQEIGIDYFLFGNAFLTVWFPSRKFLKCEKCKKSCEVEAGIYKIVNGKFRLNKCQHCKSENVYAKLHERKTRERNRIRFVRIRPQDIDIAMSSLSGHKRFYYRPDAETQGGVKKGDAFTLQNTPIEVVEAIMAGKKVELSEDLLYHFKAEGPSLKISKNGWGYPIILNAIKSIWHIALLRKANEAIALDFIVPMRGLSPSNNGSDAPGRAMDLSRFSAFVEEQLKLWRRDPNHIMLSPFPVQEFFLGGQGKSLLVNNEIELERKRIASVWGYPLEMLDGSMQFSGAQMAARLMGNRMLNYMEDMRLALDFFVPKILRYFRMPVHEHAVECAPVKTVDDIQQQGILLQLYDKNIISADTLCELIGIKVGKDEYKEIIKRVRLQSKIDSEAAYYTQVAQLMAQEKVMSLQKVQAVTFDKLFENPMEARAMMEGMQLQQGEGQVGPDGQPVQQDDGQGAMSPPGQPNGGLVDVESKAKEYAAHIKALPKSQQSIALYQIQSKYPSLASKISGYLTAEDNAPDMRPMPEQRPPRRGQK